MIVKNEEENLGIAINSARDLVDEIVVLDTGSTDNTVALAKGMGAKVNYFPWGNDFAQARNEALKYVESEWVLVLDADEQLNRKIIPELQKNIAVDNTLVVNLVRQEMGAAQSPYSLVSRLFRNHPKIRFDHPYHGMIDDSVGELLKRENHWQIVDLASVAIFHYGYQPEIIAALDKSGRARETMEVFLKQNPADTYTCSKLGALYVQLGKVEEGIKLIKRGLKLNTAQAPVLFELHYHLGNAYSRQGKFEQAAKQYQKAIAQPILPQLKLGAYNNLGSILQGIGDLENAEKLYQAALNIDPNFAVGYYNLGMLWKARGRFTEAIAAYQQAIKINPNYGSAYQNLGVVFLKLGKMPESIAAFQKAIALHQSQNPQEAERLRQGLKEIGIDL
jgi:tetratricopeptide (TPR) repeat protein